MKSNLATRNKSLLTRSGEREFALSIRKLIAQNGVCLANRLQNKIFEKVYTNHTLPVHQKEVLYERRTVKENSHEQVFKTSPNGFELDFFLLIGEINFILFFLSRPKVADSDFNLQQEIYMCDTIVYKMLPHTLHLRFFHSGPQPTVMSLDNVLLQVKR